MGPCEDRHKGGSENVSSKGLVEMMTDVERDVGRFC